jgi:MOSC domain-containing protein YiiM
MKDADQKLGIYASVVTPGSAAVGDEVELMS